MSLNRVDIYKSFDIFGYQAQIHLDKNNQVHKTVWGATCTVLYLVLVAVILYECGFELILADLDNVSNLTSLLFSYIFLILSILLY